jgi:outer membrane protein OmpA-like peptidoglycan-associated protein
VTAFRKFITAAVFASMVLLASACDSASASDTPATPKADCTAAPTLGPSTPTVAVLGQVGSATEYYDGDLQTVIAGAEGISARVLVNGVAAGTDAPSLVANTLLVGEGNNQMQRKRNLACKQDLVRTSFQDTLGNLPSPTPLDVFNAFLTLEGNLDSAPEDGNIEVVVFSLLLSTATPVNLGVPGVLNNPGEVLNQLAAQRLLPDCSRWRVYAVGGDQHTDPALDATTAAQLREFWRSFFERCGGALVAWSPHLDAFPSTNGAIAAADTSQIPVRHEDGKVVAELSGDVLFDPGRHELRPDATSALEQVLALASQATGQIVIDGYTDVGGDEADNLGLSERRCATIQTWLIAHGIDGSRVAVHGHGSSDAKFPNPTTPGEHQANRRVEISIYTT